MRIGDIDLIPVNDGMMGMDQDFYVGLDFAGHPELLADDGRVYIPIGCFLVRSGGVTVLIDAGLGVLVTEAVTCGLLPAALRDVGVAPEDIDVVVCTHLHRDHIGWLVVDDAPFFPNAVVRHGQADWEHFVSSGAEEDRESQAIMQTLYEAGRLDPLDGDLISIAPGITARHTPGHTPGHYGFVVASGDHRAYVLGDAVECPLQVEEPDFHALSDVDPRLAARTRDALLREVEGSGHPMTAAHFPDLAFGRVLAGKGRRFVPVG